MKRPFSSTRKQLIKLLSHLSLFLAVFVFSACGGGYSSSYDDNTGSYACSIKWPGNVPMLRLSNSVSKAINCYNAYIETIVFTFYDEAGGYLTDDVFLCTAHSGTVNGIPAGNNRRLVVTGEDSGGTVLYRGEQTGITIVAGETTPGGEILMKWAWTMLNLPDTGQMTNYTATFGEDSDYSINLPSYTNNGDGTVADNVTGLMWQREDDDTPRIWDDAISYCEGLILNNDDQWTISDPNASGAKHVDWRLPSKKELMSIVDYGSFSPSIGTFFPNTEASIYWSSTTYASNSSWAWFVSFYGGVNYANDKSNSYFVRCVRGGQ